MSVTSDKDMPDCLNTPTKQAKMARRLAQEHSGTNFKIKRATGPRLQGFFSRTMIVELEKDHEIVIQFRLEPLDLDTFRIARAAFGPVVPEIKLLDDAELKAAGVWPYWMTRIPGQPWVAARIGRTPESRIKATKSLGNVLAKGRLQNGNTEDVIKKQLRPHLELIVASEDKQVVPFGNVARDLLLELDTLKTLPLFVAHYDLNEVNILVGDDGEVTGLVDWELSTPLPFGMGFNRIHTLAGEYSERKFYMPPEFEKAERAFWQAIYEGVDADIRVILDSSPDLVQTAIKIGTLLGAFEAEKGKLVGVNPVVLESLEKLLSYRIPFSREANEPPYAL